MGKYLRLAQEERYQIEALLVSKMSIRSIAEQLNRNPATISREIRRNTLQARVHYKAKIAQGVSEKRRSKVKPHYKIEGQLKRYVVKRLRKEWSPEQIAGRLKREGVGSVSHETIYKFIYQDWKLGGDLWKFLRRRRRCRRSRQSARNLKRIGIRANRTWIASRPKLVEKRKRLGDIERDTMIGKRGGAVLLTIVDRTSRLTKLRWLKRLSSVQAHVETVKALKGMKVRTITNDNGPEFDHHRATAKKLNTKVYFSRPYCSWERGTNENTNGLLRQYFPRKHELDKQKLRYAERRLNNRPRKVLGFKTPLEVHRKLSRVLR